MPLDLLLFLWPLRDFRLAFIIFSKFLIVAAFCFSLRAFGPLAAMIPIFAIVSLALRTALASVFFITMTIP